MHAQASVWFSRHTLCFSFRAGMNNEIRLMVGSTELLDSYTLGFYDIEADSDMQMIFQPDVFINVNVQLLRKQVQ